MLFVNVVRFAFINTMLTCAYCGEKMHVINFTLLISVSFFFHTAAHMVFLSDSEGVPWFYLPTC
jgi:hypothetical protein